MSTTSAIKSLKFLPCVLLVVSSVAWSGELRGFDTICEIFTRAQNSDKSPEQLSAEIHEEIRAKVKSPEVITVYVGMLNAGPERRYPTIKKIVEEERQASWECPAMREMMK